MTEDQAKQTGCPIYIVTLASIVRTSGDPAEAAKTLHLYQFCRGSDCMMWRWADSDLKHGYCGLAGKL